MDRLSPAFMEEFQELMTNELKVTANEFVQNGFAILGKHKLLQKQVMIAPKLILTHMENRNRTVLNPLGVHSKGAKIFAMGADRKQCVSAVCVEMAPNGPQRLQNLRANMDLLRKFPKLLAPIDGHECYLSLGCSHTVAFCRAAQAQCMTPQDSIQDHFGKIDLLKLMQQGEFKAMLEEGWKWDVIPHDVDTAFPRFAKVVQKALNGSNSVSTQIGELDTAVNFSDMIVDMEADKALELSLIKNVKDSGMSCASYAAVLMDFVKSYGGGPGAPHIQFMDTISKQFNSSSELGEEYWKALTYTKFSSGAEHPLLRVAFALVNLTSPPKEPLLQKNDVAKAAGKKMEPLAKQAEEVLAQALEIADTLHTLCSGEALTFQREDATAPLGQLFVRIALWTIEKGKKGPDGTDLTMAQIQKSFLQPLGNMCGQVKVLDMQAGLAQS